MALSLEEMMNSVLSFHDVCTITVVAFDTAFPVRIRMADPVALFPKQFADQYHIDPLVVKHFRFHTQQELDEDAPLSGWRSIHRLQGTWYDVYFTEYYLPPVLFLHVVEG